MKFQDSGVGIGASGFIRVWGLGFIRVQGFKFRN